jgi:hypothetical protein
MKTCLFVVVGLACCLSPLSAQEKPVIVVNPFTLAQGVTWPYDVKVMQAQAVAEFKVSLGKDFDIVAEAPASHQGAVYTLETLITGWHPGNAATRFIIGMGSGRESANIEYRVVDGSGKRVVERKDTIRTDFFSQGSGSTGTLTHPFAHKIAERIENARLK